MLSQLAKLVKLIIYILTDNMNGEALIDFFKFVNLKVLRFQPFNHPDYLIKFKSSINLPS